MKVRGAVIVILAALLAAAGCGGSGEAVLVLVVTALESPPPVAALVVTLTGKPGPGSSARYPQVGAPITFPTSLAARLPANAAGKVDVDVQALDETGATVASGHKAQIEVRAGQQQIAYVQIKCGGAGCVSATPDADGGVPTQSPRCGNGRIDPGEACDTAIAAGNPGACPAADCDDRVPCTRDTHQGDGCTAECTHVEITDPIAGDGCCPAGADNGIDLDCSPTCGDGVVDPGETCDTGVPNGSPGSCPSISDCADGDACAADLLASAGTCSAICVHYPVTRLMDGDGCCPPGGYRDVDRDCPVACGNGIKESGENCDVGILPPAPGSCPTACDDGDLSTTDFITGTGCDAHCIKDNITAPISGDGYCPPGANAATDSDCSHDCKNNVLEPGESCQPGAPGDASCPTSCAPLKSACLVVSLVGSASDCSAHCEVTLRTACSRYASDGCCPAGCTSLTDGDCPPNCGDGVVQEGAGETCDTAIPAGHPGACPTDCADANACTEDRLVSAGTCTDRCVNAPIHAFLAGDGCCPSGANFNIDPDCSPLCGNGVVEPPAETCDPAVPGSCPSSCPASDACRPLVLRGSASSCSAFCEPRPITGCRDGDGCCPPGCTTADDTDCAPVCGNGVIDGNDEKCDRGITAGFGGACPSSCDDADACTVDLVDGSVEGCTRVCLHHPVTACLGGDGCCPPGCNARNDADCATVCGDGRIGGGETCDPASTCPTACADDGDPCTREVLTGSPATCDVACRHVPIMTCSANVSDRCCPNGCTHGTDVDC
jgi:hypothetical protein